MNLNKKARDELLEKKRAKEEEQLKQLNSKVKRPDDTVSRKKDTPVKLKHEQVLAAYKGQLVALDYGDDDDEHENDDDDKVQKKKDLIITLKPRQLQVNREQANKRKTPILKAGQIQANETTSTSQADAVQANDPITSTTFIGPQLPVELLRHTQSNDHEDHVYESNQMYRSNDDENYESSANSVPQVTVDKQQKKQISFTKEELVKYENLSKMSQMYARFNQGGLL